MYGVKSRKSNAPRRITSSAPQRAQRKAVTTSKRAYAPRKAYNQSITRNYFKEELIPARRTIKLEYATPVNGFTTSGANPTVSFRFFLNNIYEPYQAVTTNVTPSVGVKANSVQEYTSLKAMYNKYIVYGAKVEFQLTTVSAYPLHVGMNASQDTLWIPANGSAIPSDVISRDYVDSKILVGGSGQTGTVKFSKYYDIAKCRGLWQRNAQDYRYDTANEVAMDSTTTPGSTWLNLFWGPTSDASLGFTVDGFVKIQYYLVAFDKKNETDQAD